MCRYGKCDRQLAHANIFREFLIVSLTSTFLALFQRCSRQLKFIQHNFLELYIANWNIKWLRVAYAQQSHVMKVINLACLVLRVFVRFCLYNVNKRLISYCIVFWNTCATNFHVIWYSKYAKIRSIQHENWSCKYFRRRYNMRWPVCLHRTNRIGRTRKTSKRSITFMTWLCWDKADRYKTHKWDMDIIWNFGRTWHEYSKSFMQVIFAWVNVPEYPSELRMIN